MTAANKAEAPAPGYGPPSELCAIPVLGYQDGEWWSPIFDVCVICGGTLDDHLTPEEQIAKGFAVENPPARKEED